MWRTTYQGLLKRVEASLEKLKSLDKVNRWKKWKKWTGQAYEEDRARLEQKRDKTNAFRNDTAWHREGLGLAEVELVPRPSSTFEPLPNWDSRTGRVSSQNLKRLL